MNYFFLVAALVIAVVDWIAVARKWRLVGYLAKPGVMLALLAWVWQAGGFGAGRLAWFGVGLLFSLAGDIFLMLPRERFIAGLGSFLLAHVAYLVGFNAMPPPLNAASLILLLLVMITGWQIYSQVRVGLKIRGLNRLKLPVLVYMVVINLMLVSALLTLLEGAWSVSAAFLASGGALLFCVSDTFLAWNKFVRPLPFGRLRVRVTYHLGQALIVLGAVWNFLR